MVVAVFSLLIAFAVAEAPVKQLMQAYGPETATSDLARTKLEYAKLEEQRDRAKGLLDELVLQKESLKRELKSLGISKAEMAKHPRMELLAHTVEAQEKWERALIVIEKGIQEKRLRMESLEAGIEMERMGQENPELADILRDMEEPAGKGRGHDLSRAQRAQGSACSKSSKRKCSNPFPPKLPPGPACQHPRVREKTDIAVLGGGILGLATAHRFLQRHPGASLTLFEKESEVCSHQTGHNSGVLHSGIYYKPGSLKSENCLRGKAWMEEFCQEHGVPFERCGKVIVATGESQLPALDRILERGQAAGVECERIGPERLKETGTPRRRHRRHPCTQGWHRQLSGRVPSPASRDHRRRRRVAPGPTGHRPDPRPRQGHHPHPGRHLWAAKVVNCTGLQSDRTLELAGLRRKARIVPFRGEYYELTPEAQSLCKNLIYPVPDPKFPFLGVHFTRMIEGGIECGPNAVLALAREGYRWRDIAPRDLWDTLSYGGFWKLALRHWKTGSGEVWRSISKKAFVKALSRLIPEIRPEHLVPAPAGVRAQALDPTGAMVDDFLIQKEGALLHVLNAPSPAATSALSIAETVIQRLGPH